jgi:hypothetical protein
MYVASFVYVTGHLPELRKRLYIFGHLVETRSPGLRCMRTRMPPEKGSRRLCLSLVSSAITRQFLSRKFCAGCHNALNWQLSQGSSKIGVKKADTFLAPDWCNRCCRPGDQHDCIEVARELSRSHRPLAAGHGHSPPAQDWGHNSPVDHFPLAGTGSRTRG